MKEMECPLCGAMIEIPKGTILFEEFECHNCDATLEYSNDGMIDIDEDE